MTNLTRAEAFSLIQIATKWGSNNARRAMIRAAGFLKWIDNHFYFSLATIFIQGLVLSHGLVYYGIICILMTYLNDPKNPHLQRAAITTNAFEGISAVMVVVFAHLAYQYFSHFKMIACTNAAYVLGLLMWACAGDWSSKTAAAVIYGSLVLVALGEAGRSANLSPFLESEYLKQQKNPGCINDKQLRRGKEAVERLPWYLGAIVSIIVPISVLMYTNVMGISYLVFLLGFSCYLNKSNTNNPIHPELEESALEQVVQIKQHDQVTELSHKGPRTRGGKLLCDLLKEFEEGKLPKEISLILSAFLVYSLVEATGSTFFLEQIDKLQNPLADAVPPALYEIMVTILATYLTKVTWNFLFREKSSLSIKLALWKIGCGMACSVLACVAALWVEFYRIDQVKMLEGYLFVNGLKDDDSTTISMSIFALIPQFFLLGMMEGLAVEGMADLFVERLGNGTETTDEEKEILKDYASYITDFVLGIGKLITALVILALSGTWFHDNINTSSLEDYYAVVIFLSCVNCCYYCYVASRTYANANSSPSAGQELQRIQQPLPEAVLEIA